MGLWMVLWRGIWCLLAVSAGDDGEVTVPLTGVRSERPGDRNANWRHFDDDGDCVVVGWLIRVSDVLVRVIYAWVGMTSFAVTGLSFFLKQDKSLVFTLWHIVSIGWI